MSHFQFYLPIIKDEPAVLYNRPNLPPDYKSYDSAERSRLILNYWEDTDNIQYFPIGFRTIENMFDKSFNKQTVALHVTDIQDKDKVLIEWIPVQTRLINGASIPTFALEISDVQDYYFLLKRAFYNPEILPAFIGTAQKTKGMKAAEADNANVLYATMGKNTDNSYCVIINAAQLLDKEGDGGAGGNGYVPGAKIPGGS